MEKIAIFLKKSSKNGGNGRKTMKKGKILRLRSEPALSLPKGREN